MAAFQPIHGHCQCGAVRYIVTAPPEQLYHCHCSMCRRCHGTVFATYAVVRSEHLVIERGKGNLATYDSSPPTHRHFCKTCGCQLLIDDDRVPHLRWFTPGTCDWPSAEPPAAPKHVYVGSKVPWYRIADGLPQEDEM